MVRPKENFGAERRRYIRLDSVFPVEFRLVSLDEKKFLTEWLQGFTNNIGKGGLCLSVNNLKFELAQALRLRQAKLFLEIDMPILLKPVSAKAAVAWVKEAEDSPNKYLIGLSYEHINAAQNKKIMRYAWAKKLFLPAVFALVLILGLGFAINGIVNAKLIKGNRVLVEQLVKILQDSSIAKQQIKKLNRERQELNLKTQALELRIKTAEEERGRLNQARVDEIGQLNSLLEKMAKEKNSLQEQTVRVQQQENSIAEDLVHLEKRKSTLEKANLDKMFQWLKVHQSPRTGLVMSFEGDSDIQNWAFVYDQSLVLQAYVIFADFERARKLLDFFKNKAQRQDQLFYNAYYVQDGNPAEYTVHCGPNIWLGIAILHYAQKSQDRSFLRLAEEIAQAIMRLQDQDPDCGIRGGPNINWYATEHNLDAYAFFNMLHKVTGNPQYLAARDKALSWLVKHTYDKSEIPIKRGKGDSTIATDTYAWSVAAVGPQKLEELGMNPDRIMEFAEQNCAAEVVYTRPQGQEVTIRGFDFAPQRHVARGGVVSSEWTAQMIMAFRIMADFYYKRGMMAKSRAYDLKADTYLGEIGNMVISSPSPSGQGESCLPYATQDFVDTGHGWMTPKGSNTGSVAGTAYTLFAYYRYNPLELKD
jgi:hypothetical protein